MKVEYLFSRNSKVGSKLIAWAASHEDLELDEYPSHIAVLIDELWVLESTFESGVRLLPYKAWQEINEQLYRLPSSVCSSKVLKVSEQIWGHKYDWKGLAYFGFCYVRHIVCGTPFPTKNKWQSERSYFCTELVARLEDKNFSMTSPARVCYEMLLKFEKDSDSRVDL